MRGQCGSRGFIPLNCPYNEPAVEPETASFRKLLVDTCGPEYASGPVCCEEEQLTQLVDQVQKAEPIIASCPACWANFMQFWCSFTCSPNQSAFVNVTSLYNSSGTMIVDSTDFWVGDKFGSQFYDSCKDIKFGSSNGYAMDFIGGGADNWHDMLTYMGKERPGLGSPFQIDFPPLELGDALERYNAVGKSCNDSDPAYRCSCVDCEAVCPTLPPTREQEPDCYVGKLKCWTFAMIMTYGLVLVFVLGLVLLRSRHLIHWVQKYTELDIEPEESRGLYERVALTDDQDEALDDHLLDPDHTPRRYWLNSKIQSWFYRQGLICARHPWSVIILGLLFVTLCSSGWYRFSIERDPINLWVSPSSRALAEKNHFDANFSPFYRTTQLFLVSEQSEPIASMERLQSLFKLEDEIRSMKTDAHEYRLQDVCFHPNGDACIVQSVTGYWESDIDNFDPETWKSYLLGCTEEPATCLPEFQQPLKPQMILGGYKDNDYLSARAFVVTFVLKNSLDESEILKAEEWEKSLLHKILSTVNERPEWEGVRISYSTEVSFSGLSADRSKLLTKRL